MERNQIKPEERFSYYDGPVRDSGRTVEEIEQFIKKEEERCNKMTSWNEAYGV